jgi:multicomponent Na+:H+ antiporter subunit D
MAVGALLVAAIPPFTTFMGKSLLEESTSGVGGYGWLIAVYIFASAMTGGAILRIAGRVFLGWGPAEGPHEEQARAAEERVHETIGGRDHTPLLMVLTPATLLVAALVLGLIPGAVPGVERLAEGFVGHHDYAAWVLHGAQVTAPIPKPSHISGEDYGYGAIAIVGMLIAAGLGLFGRRLRLSLPRLVRDPARNTAAVLRGLHNGHIGDYIAWWSAGVSLVGGVCLVALR